MEIGPKSLMKRIHAFEYWCYRRMLKISWKDKDSNTDVFKRITDKEPTFYKEIARQKLAYTGNVLRRSGGRNAFVILEGKFLGKKQR